MFSNNTIKTFSDNNITVKDNVFYTPVTVSGTASIVLQLAGGPWGAIASSVFSLVAGQLAKDQENKRFDEINHGLQEIKGQLRMLDAKIDRIDIALRLISDQNDQVLEAIHGVPARLAYSQVLRDISNIQDHWTTWTRTAPEKLTPRERSDMKAAYDDLHRDAGLLYTEGDPTYAPALAIALRLDLDLALMLNLGPDEANDIKKGYRRFLAAALAPGSVIVPGDQVQPTDSFPTRLAKRKALIGIYLGIEYKTQAINFTGGEQSACLQPWGGPEVPPKPGSFAHFYGDVAVKDAFFWDPPIENGVFLRLIRANALNLVVGPIDERFIYSERGFDNEGKFVEIGTAPAAFGMFGAWDLVAAVGSTGTMFEFLGAYYRPSQLDKCSPAPGLPSKIHPLRFGVLSSGAPPKRVAEFFQRYGNVIDNDLNIFAQEKLMLANRQVRLMAIDAIAFAAASEFSEALERPSQFIW